MNNTETLKSPSGQKQQLMIVVADDKFFLSHRLEVGVGAINNGYDVTIVGGENGSRHQIESTGFNYTPLPSPASGHGLNSSIKILKNLIALFRKQPKAIVHLIGVKMILLGNLAMRLTGGRNSVINAYSGLGITFQDPDSMKARMVSSILRIVCSKKKGKSIAIVQNHDDEMILNSRNIITAPTTEYIKGSGVDLNRFKAGDRPAVLPDGRMRVIFSGRLLKSKGIGDFIKAAEILRHRWEDKVEFLICGGCHPNPDSMTSRQMEELCDGHYLVWAGHMSNMPEILASSRIMAFPSYYREGVPRALIEALAAGLPIVTCDSVGCRDTIDGNGFLVQPRNPEQLADRIDCLLADEALCRKFGRKSRELAQKYDVNGVVRRHLDIYNTLN